MKRTGPFVGPVFCCKYFTPRFVEILMQGGI